MSMSTLSFTLCIAQSAADLHDAALVRAQSYGHHVAALRDALAQPDALDTSPGTVVLLCRDKATGQAIGTARIQRNHPQPLLIEASVVLPDEIAARTRAEITRLAILPGADAQVRPALVKACYLYAVATQIRTLVIGARSPALIRLYRALGFAELFGSGQMVPLAHAGGLPHQVLAFDVVSAERTWHAAGHGLYPFMVETWHPDLQLLAPPPVVVQPVQPVPVPVPVVPAVAAVAPHRAAHAPAVPA